MISTPLLHKIATYLSIAGIPLIALILMIRSRNYFMIDGKLKWKLFISELFLNIFRTAVVIFGIVAATYLVMIFLSSDY